ncbi:MAG: ATP-binding protein [Hoeflea sp.]|uniref:ATP-binding protein n=1 Tax=Hoeflea sp. TaxID=1940281 RepID=UPI003EF31194
MLLEQAGFTAINCTDVTAFVAAIDDDLAFAVATEEALSTSDLGPISSWIESQPSWSDFPFIVLTQRGGGPERNPAAARLSEVLGNVNFLERPFHPTTFASLAKTALRGRLRQYDARGRLEELDEGERRLHTALEAGRLGSWELDLDTKLLTTSAMCRQVFGRPADAGFSYDDLIDSIHEDDRERMQLAVQATVETGVDYAIEYRTIWPGGSLHWAEIRAQLYRNRLGEAVKMVGVSADITQRKNDEQNQRLQNEILEDRVTARTAELEAAHAVIVTEAHQREMAEGQLRQAMKMDAIGQLTGGVAHDFNNLLMAVLGNLELLRKHSAGDTKAERLIDGAVQGAKRGASLTQRLLAFARRQDLQVSSVDLGGLISGMRDLINRSVGASIAIETDLPEETLAALADANQVELALLNLAVNARDAMPDGGVIRIGLRSSEITGQDDLEAGQYAIISVTDTGCGMNAETLAKAVDPFFSTKELGKGTGLGLSMIHGLAIQLNGRLKLSSTPGKGTTAELWIPKSEHEEQKENSMAKTQPINTDAPIRRRILMVDDDILIAMSSVDMLEDLGHEVVEANSGAQALDILKSDSGFDLMISDFSMPGMNGADLAMEARRLLPDLPILLATGYAELPPGADIDVPRLGKPYSQEQLAIEIAKLLQNR